MSDNSPYPDRTVTAAGGPPTDDLATRTSLPSGSSDATRTSFPAVPPEAGDSFGNYELSSEIARGGMGVVYRAKQKGLDRTVALKMILGQADEGLRARLLVEAKSAGALDHPNVVPIYDCGEVNGQLFFTMAFVDGPDLKRYAESRGKLPLPEAMKLFGQVVSGVAHAHGKGIIHRDLKPANVLINRDGRPQITDFGLAKQTDKNSEMTKTGQVMGTPAYMAPEQARGLKVGPAADVYALGGIMYYLLTGDPPFVGETVTDILVKLVTEQPVPPRTHIPDLPPELEVICLKCLSKNPEDRYPDAQALAAELAPQLDRYLPSTLAEFGSTAGSGFSTAGRGSGVGGPYGLQSTNISESATAPAAPAGSRTWLVAAGVAVAVVAAVGVAAVALKGNGTSAVAVAPPAGTGGNSAVVGTGPDIVIPPVVPVAKGGDMNTSKPSITPSVTPPVTQPIAATIPFPARMGRQDVKFQFELLGAGTLGENEVSQFKDGDRLRFRVQAQDDCHLRVWTVDSTGTIVQLFPSQHDPDDRLTAGVTREMPGGRGYTMTARPSAGGKVEHLRALVSTTPINRVEPDQQVEGGFGLYASAASRDRLFSDVRGIEVAALKMETRVADAELLYFVGR